MTLLQGLNYDFSRQQNSKIKYSIGAGGVTLYLENTEGFAIDDYLLVAPNTERAEIILISAINDDEKLTIGALKFNHIKSDKVYKLPYNQMKFYYCDTATGTYLAIASSETDLNYTNLYTNYDYAIGTSILYYKRTFYNSNSATESDIALSDYWQTSEEDLYITPDELRRLLQFGKNDYPSPEDMRLLISLAQDKISLDVDSSNLVILRLATFMLAKANVLRALASKSVGKGYVTINAEGRNITKSFQELVLEAENTQQEYLSFINSNTRREVSATNYMETADIDEATRQQFIDIMNGTQNALDYEADTKFSYGRRQRRR